MKSTLIKELTQRKKFASKNFKLYNNKLVYEFKDLNSAEKFEIEFEYIGYKKTFDQDFGFIQKGFGWLCIFTPVIIYLWNGITRGEWNTLPFLFFWLLGIILALIFLLRTDKNYITLAGAQNIEFFRDKSNEEAVNEFIDEVMKTSKEYLRKKYLQWDDYTLPEEYNHRLLWLRERDLITESEDELMREEFLTNRLLS